MKPAHARILKALARGGSVRRIGRQKKIDVSIWVSYGKYESFTARVSTINEMEELGLLRCIDQYAHDTEWEAVKSEPVGKPLIEILFCEEK